MGKKIITICISLFLGLYASLGVVFASETDGTIPVNSYAWGENIGWINFGVTNGNVHVTSTAVTGYAWSSTYGWINLSPTNGGIINNGKGTLGGNVWSPSLGWIPFSGVTINSSGKFTGMAGTAGSTAGRINFDCTNCSVTTDWRPASVRSSSTSSSIAGSSTVCRASKPASAPTLTSAEVGTNSVTLTWVAAGSPLTYYLVAYGTSAGSIQYGNPNVGNTTSYTVSGLSGGTTYYFKVKAINDCMPGDFSNEVLAVPGGAAIGNAPAAGFVPASEISSRLLDIALIIDNPLVDDSRKLKARVTFTSFGTEDTPVKMEFIVLDKAGKQVYKTTGRTVIQTEGVYNKSFDKLVIPDGKYTLLLKTLYGNNVYDEFRASFEVIEVKGGQRIDWRLLFLPLSLLILYLIFKKIHRQPR